MSLSTFHHWVTGINNPNGGPLSSHAIWVLSRRLYFPFWSNNHESASCHLSSLYRGEAEERENKARGGWWEWQARHAPFPSSHRPQRACYFLIIVIHIGIPSGSLNGGENLLPLTGTHNKLFACERPRSIIKFKDNLIVNLSFFIFLSGSLFLDETEALSFLQQQIQRQRRSTGQTDIVEECCDEGCTNEEVAEYCYWRYLTYENEHWCGYSSPVSKDNAELKSMWTLTSKQQEQHVEQTNLIFCTLALFGWG